MGKLFLKLILKIYEVRLFLKQSDYREEIDVMEEIEMNPKGFIQLDKYHKWQYRKYPNLLLAGEMGGTGKIKSSLWNGL